MGTGNWPMQGQAESSPYPTPGEATVTRASDQRKTRHAPQATSAAQSGAGSGGGLLDECPLQTH